MMMIVSYIRDFFAYVFDLLKSGFSMLSSIIKTLGHCVTFLTDVIQALPTVFIVAAGVLITVSVLYKILGREGE